MWLNLGTLSYGDLARHVEYIGAQFRAAGIGTQVHYVPIYRHPLYADLGLDPSSFPNTEAAYARLLSLPLYPDLSHDEQDAVVDALRVT